MQPNARRRMFCCRSVPGGGRNPCARSTAAEPPAACRRISRAASGKSRTGWRGCLLRASTSRNFRFFKTLILPKSGRLMPQSDPFPHYIEFRHVSKTFDRPILVDCNFHINPGETVAIIGRSGVGKSVSLSHIMGFLKPDAGTVIVAHEDITDFSEDELRRIRKKGTMVFHSGALDDSLTE